VLDFGKVFWHSHSKYSNLRKNMTSMNIEILEAVSEKLEVRFGCNKKSFYRQCGGMNHTVWSSPLCMWLYCTLWSILNNVISQIIVNFDIDRVTRYMIYHHVTYLFQNTLDQKIHPWYFVWQWPCLVIPDWYVTLRWYVSNIYVKGSECSYALFS